MPKKVLGTDPFAPPPAQGDAKAKRSDTESSRTTERSKKAPAKRIRLLEPAVKSPSKGRPQERRGKTTRRPQVAKRRAHTPPRETGGPRPKSTTPPPQRTKQTDKPEMAPCTPLEDLAETSQTDSGGKSRLLNRVLEAPLLSRMGKLWGAFQLRNRSEHVDEFGKDPVYSAKVEPLLEWLYQKYWRVEVAGIKNVPDKGRALLVANHSGMLPFDGLMISQAVRLESPLEREVRFLVEDMFITMPFLSPILTRIGAVRASQENAERLLAQDHLVCVFPEGNKGTGKLFKERYRLQRFGRGGFIKLCIRTKTPLVPVAVMGAEEIYPVIARLERLARPLGMPYLAVTPGWPLLGPLGLAPLPSKWKIVFGRPIRFDKYTESDADNEVLVSKLREEVREEIQGMLDEMVAERKSVWFG